MIKVTIPLQIRKYFLKFIENTSGQDYYTCKRDLYYSSQIIP